MSLIKYKGAEMSNKLVGSSLTREMLERGDEQVWCAVSNDSEAHAMSIIENSDYSSLVYIKSFHDDEFICRAGKSWRFAIPVRKIELTQKEVGL